MRQPKNLLLVILRKATSCMYACTHVHMIIILSYLQETLLWVSHMQNANIEYPWTSPMICFIRSNNPGLVIHHSSYWHGKARVTFKLVNLLYPVVSEKLLMSLAAIWHSLHSSYRNLWQNRTALTLSKKLISMPQLPCQVRIMGSSGLRWRVKCGHSMPGYQKIVWSRKYPCCGTT